MDKPKMFKVRPFGKKYGDMLISPEDVSTCREWIETDDNGKPLDEKFTVLILKSGHQVIFERPFEVVQQNFEVINL